MKNDKSKLDFEFEQTEPLKVGASIPVSLIREAYETKGMRAALEIGHDMFTAGLSDGRIIAIARKEATLRGFTPHIVYLDVPCKTCLGKGETPNASGGTEDCLTCHGDGFDPPNPFPLKKDR